jgi:hypothetical protein
MENLCGCGSGQRKLTTSIKRERSEDYDKDLRDMLQGKRGVCPV